MAKRKNITPGSHVASSMDRGGGRQGEAGGREWETLDEKEALGRRPVKERREKKKGAEESSLSLFHSLTLFFSLSRESPARCGFRRGAKKDRARA